MSRVLTWVSDHSLQGWACSQCEWNFPVPTLLTEPAAKSAYDRLGSAKFAEHECSGHVARARTADVESFAERARKLVLRGFKPKDAADIVLQEIVLERRNEPGMAERAREDAGDFLRRVKEGLI